MAVVAWLLRVVVAAFLYREQLSASPDHWHFGWEVGQVARSIALRQEFGSPLHRWTGPTAMLPPVHAYLLATVFRFFGLFTGQSAFAALAINSLFSALTCVPIFFTTHRVLGAEAGTTCGLGMGLLSLRGLLFGGPRVGLRSGYADACVLFLGHTGVAQSRRMDELAGI
jgi:hypothetical protein